MTPDEIAEIVVAEAFGDCDPDIAKWLRNHPAEWKAAILTKLEGLRGQYERAKADEAAELAQFQSHILSADTYNERAAERQRWRASASPVRAALETRLREAKDLARPDRKVGREARRLRDAIERHRSESVRGECEPEPYDLALWAELEKIG